MQKSFVKRGKEVIAIEIEALTHVCNNLGDSFDNALAILSQCTGRVVVMGIGKSGLIGRKLAATFSSTGTPAFFMHPVEGAHGDLGSVTKDDVVIAISYSGKNEELLAILPTLRTLGIHIIALTSGLNSELSKLANVVIDCTVPREACPMNLAPTASTTATLAIGDALAVCLMEIKQFTTQDFKKFHPGGALGERLKRAVADIMHTTNLPLLTLPSTMQEALIVMDKGKLGAVLVVNADQKLFGILTDGDIRRALCQKTLSLDGDIRHFVTKDPHFASPEQSAAEIIDIMEDMSITVLPVIDSNGCITGIIHMHDLLGKGQIRFANEE